jgi:hypothetical protein
MPTAVTVTVTDPKVLYKAGHGKVELIDVGELLFAAVDGCGAPADTAFAQAVSGLYTVAYGVRFALRDQGVDEKVSALEAVWTMPDAPHAFEKALERGGFDESEKGGWSWRAMIRLPWAADASVIASVKRQALRRHPDLGDALAGVQVAPWREGLCVQTLHVGPYSDELPTVALLHRFISDHGYVPVGSHHEIYLSDPRRCAERKLRTILRQPISRAAEDGADLRL